MPKHPRNKAAANPQTYTVWKAGLIVLLVFLAYLPALGGGYIWDDDAYVINNATLKSFAGLKQIWFQLGATPQYYPLVQTSFWLEHHLWGLNPSGYHIINVVLHALSAVLLWTLLRKLQVPASWMVAAVFALHPVNVESVAWITERKNVLSTAFYLAAALAYLRWLDTRRNPLPLTLSASAQSLPAASRQWYLMALFFFFASLLSKTVACSLPAALLLVCWWKRGKLRSSDIIPLLPFFAAGIALGLLTPFVEKHYVKAEGMDWSLTTLQRFLIAGRAVWFYPAKLIWPMDLTFIYPRWVVAPALWWQWVFPAAAIAVVVLLWHFRNRIGRAPLVAILFFGGTLFPALGFINIYPMRYTFVADHYQYVAGIGLIALLVSTAVGLLNRQAIGQPSRITAAAVILLLLGILTWRQCGMYSNIETLWRTTIARNPRCAMAHSNLGGELLSQGRTDEAYSELKAAAEIDPDDLTVNYDLGFLENQRGQWDQAAIHFKKVVEASPDDAESHYRLAVALLHQGQRDDAIAHLHQALQLRPGYPEAQERLRGLEAPPDSYPVQSN